MENEKYVAYVGTYTHGSSKGIHMYDVDVKEGTMKEIKEIPISNTSYIVKSKNGKYLYSTTDEGVAVFSIKPDGDLELINKVNIGAMRGCYLSVDDSGKYLFVAGYHDGKVTVVHTHQDGRLGRVFDGVYHKGIGSVAERSFRPHVSCVTTTPDGKYICAVDNGIDQIKLYRINTTRHRIELADILRCKRESGPREMVFSKNGKFAYILFELTNVVGVYRYDSSKKNPEFECIQIAETLSDQLDPIHDCAAAITLSPDGKYLFASTAGDNSVAMFAIDEETGMLTRKCALPISGEYPKDIALFPDGKHLAVVNHESGSITTFAVDYEKGLLIMKGKPMKVDTPNCILISKVNE